MKPTLADVVVCIVVLGISAIVLSAILSSYGCTPPEVPFEPKSTTRQRRSNTMNRTARPPGFQGARPRPTLRAVGPYSFTPGVLSDNDTALSARRCHIRVCADGRPGGRAQ